MGRSAIKELDNAPRCPACKAPYPAFQVALGEGRWECSACGKSDDLLGYLMAKYDMSFVQALRLLGRDAGIDVKED